MRKIWDQQSPFYHEYRKLNVNFTYFIWSDSEKFKRISNMNFTKNDPIFTKNLHFKSRKIYQLIVGYFT